MTHSISSVPSDRNTGKRKLHRHAAKNHAIEFDIPRIVFHDRNTRSRKRKDRLSGVKNVLYISGAVVTFMGVYTKVSYDWIESIKVNANTPLLSPVASVSASLLPSPSPVFVAIADTRVKKLETYLTKKKSPLAPYAALIVKEADDHDIGWTKIVSISAIESTFGTNLSGSFNAWNIMEFKNGVRVGAYNFASWEEGIKYTSALLDKSYRQNEVKAVQVKYCPSYECSPNWVPMVLSTTDEIKDIK